MDELIKHVRSQLAIKIQQHLWHKETIENILKKLEYFILPKKNFYSFKLYQETDPRFEAERDEIRKLIEDHRKYGRRFIKNFNET